MSKRTPKPTLPFASRIFANQLDSSWGADINGYDAEAMRSAMRHIERWFGESGKYFRVSSAGWENVPDAPAVIVANHSGGTTIPDAWGLAWAWCREFGFERTIHPMAHDMVWVVPAIARRFAALGILRANRALAHEVLTEWKRDIIVMPGGDQETWRPYTQRHQVRWNGRRGYVKTAMKAGVPIVPVACTGAHSTLIVLSDGRKFARAVGLRRFARAEIFPVSLSFPWGLAVGPLPHMPPPSHFRYLVGKPIQPPEEVSEGEEPSMLAVREMDAKVRAEMQRMLNRLRDGELA
jgi:1-acyl-sn-glycerol-3-phosphate acyltransferase